jgi:GTP-binding protein
VPSAGSADIVFILARRHSGIAVSAFIFLFPAHEANEKKIIGIKKFRIVPFFGHITKTIPKNLTIFTAVEKTNFIDLIRVFCRSGHGGAGSRHFMRNKLTAFGGPDGGDGGRGGHIILRGNKNLWTLLHLRYFKNILAENGTNGSKNNSTGKDGKDIYIDVPLGTIARDEETGKLEAEILGDGQEEILMRGGKGGLGNSHFATPTNQAPAYAQPGEPGEEGWKIMELKVLADVGLVGFPNAGKSTLLSVITAATPKIADYAFTTLTPQLGMVAYRDNKSFCVADLPGIIEGAAEGKGLGYRFLRHIERNPVLLLLIPADSKDHREEFEILVNELKEYNPELLDKKFIIAISKSDMLDEELRQAISEELPDGIEHIFISSITNNGLTELKDMLWDALTEKVT